MKMKKAEIPLSLSYRLLHPRLTVLVSCVDKAGKENVITLAWSMPVSINPPIVDISVAPKRLSHQLIEETNEFVVNVPTMNLIRETLFCGRRSGRRYDKIKECVAHLECRLEDQITIGDHTLFISLVLAGYTDKGAFGEKFDVREVKPIYHMGGDEFVTLTPEAVSPRL